MARTSRHSAGQQNEASSQPIHHNPTGTEACGYVHSQRCIDVQKPSNLSPVSPASRRTFVYWLLLLLPTVGVGIGAILLLQREQTRLTERATYADEARRAAVTARAQLIAENVELLVGDVQTGLLESLAAEQAVDADALLDQLEQANPLVRAVFRCAADGRILRPAQNSMDDDARGFLRRFGRPLVDAPPWRINYAQTDAAGSTDDFKQKKVADEPRARQQVALNVAKVQSARREVQALSKNNYAGSAPVASAPTAAAAAPTERRRRVETKEEERPTDRIGGIQLADKDNHPSRDGYANRGWFPLKVEGKLHLLGWVQSAGAGEVRGIELEMAALISRLGGTMPGEISPTEGYALRDDQKRILHQAGAVPRVSNSSWEKAPTVDPAIIVPLAADLLPGWEVVAYVPATGREHAAGSGFFLIGTLLVGIFLTAIVSGGFLLLRQARQSEAEAAQKTSFVANVSHEFKTPLTTIRLYSELLEQGRVPDEAKRGEYLRTIGRETQRLARLVGNALDFSRLEQGQKKYARDNLDLRAEFTRLLDTQVPRLAEAGLVLQRELPVDPVNVMGDRDAIEQIMLNLLDNAVKYGAAGGEVTVELAAKPGGGAVVRVSDRGAGVPAEHRARIFDKFHRVDDTLTAEKTGTGLGLSIARQLARGLGGELRYEARAGGGAGFILELP